MILRFNLAPGIIALCLGFTVPEMASYWLSGLGILLVIAVVMYGSGRCSVILGRKDCHFRGRLWLLLENRFVVWATVAHRCVWVMAGLFWRHLEFLQVAGRWCTVFEYRMRDLCNKLGFMMETRIRATSAYSGDIVVWVWEGNIHLSQGVGFSIGLILWGRNRLRH